MTRNSAPRTLAEAVDRLEQSLTVDDLSAFAAHLEENLVDCHWGLGMRNEFGLWYPGSSLLQDCAAHREAAGSIRTRPR